MKLSSLLAIAAATSVAAVPALAAAANPAASLSLSSGAAQGDGNSDGGAKPHAKTSTLVIAGIAVVGVVAAAVALSQSDHKSASH
jgi:hypothetical protein